MKLDKICIRNYKQFKEGKLDLHNDLTVIAGPNNSGKTAILELLDFIIKKKKSCLTVNHFSLENFHSSLDELMNKITLFLLKEGNKKSDLLLSLEEDFNKQDNSSILLPNPIEVDFYIQFEKEESIKYFSKYLMELDDSNEHFYFRYSFKVDTKRLIKELDRKIEQIKKNISAKNSDVEGDEALVDELNIKMDSRSQLKKILKKAISNSLIEEYRAFNKDFTIKSEKMSREEFRELFEFHYIKATRPLKDYSDDTYNFMSNKLLEILKKDEKWIEILETTPDELEQVIVDNKIQERFNEISLQTLNEQMARIRNISDDNLSELQVSLNLGEDELSNFLKSILETTYKYGDYYLEESSQGLGFSNLNYIFLILDDYAKLCKKNLEDDKNIVNLFFLEEPEAHMHPHMQRMLVKELKDYSTDFQRIVTTHSNELVKTASLSNVRAIRPDNDNMFSNHIYNFERFERSLVDDEEKHFYKTMFAINYSDLLFSKKAILYEGDTEKLYIEALINSTEKFGKLSSQYISYIQIGGAYAHRYQKLLKFLHIKSLIITDIDYKKGKLEIHEIEDCTSTNGGLKIFYISPQETMLIEEFTKEVCTDCSNLEICEDDFFEELRNVKKGKYKSGDKDYLIDYNKEGKEKCNVGHKDELKMLIESIFENINRPIKIKELYEWKQTDGRLKVVYQNIQDNHTRTLEEAILCKLLDMEINETLSKNEWEIIKESKNLEFSIPKDDDINIREIVRSTGGNKSDFMHSLILRNVSEENYIESLPNYIKVGLEWLI